MFKIFRIEIAILLQILVKVIAENKTEEIEALEKEKSDIFKQINAAIDESVKLLKVGNDSEAVLGVKYMKKLKDELKEINGTDFKDQRPQESVNETRRSRMLKLSMFDLANVFKKNKKTKTKLEKDANKIEIQKKLDEWLLERELENLKIKEYKAKQRLNIKLEKCPRYGVGSKSKKKTRRNDDDKKKKRKVKKTLPKYPCCRKCCKKSYMGCL